jgi:hypothetical protein
MDLSFLEQGATPICRKMDSPVLSILPDWLRLKKITLVLPSFPTLTFCPGKPQHHAFAFGRRKPFINNLFENPGIN